MKATRTLDELHRIVLPHEVVSKMGWKEKSEIDIEMAGEGIVTLTSHAPFCRVCGGRVGKLIQVKSAYLCGDCIRKVGEQNET